MLFSIVNVLAAYIAGIGKPHLNLLVSGISLDRHYRIRSRVDSEVEYSRCSNCEHRVLLVQCVDVDSVFYSRDRCVFAAGIASDFRRLEDAAVSGAAAPVFREHSMKKKILLIPSWYPNEKDPISGIFIQEQAVALSKKYDVAVLIPGMAAWRNVINKTAGDKSIKKIQEGLPVYCEYALALDSSRSGSQSTTTLFAGRLQKGFRRVLKEWGTPDLIHAHVVLPAGWSALKVAKRYGIPIVLTEHSSPFSMHLGTELSRRLVRETLTGVDQGDRHQPGFGEATAGFPARTAD